MAVEIPVRSAGLLLGVIAMERLTLFVLLGAALLAVPLMLANANVDGNCDGCVDLADYAMMQRDFTGPGCPPREVRSFYGTGTTSFVVIPEVPGENGFVVTDIVSRHDWGTPVLVTLTEEFAGESEVKLRYRMLPDVQAPLHFNSGIPLRSGSSLTVDGIMLKEVTISGYTY